MAKNDVIALTSSRERPASTISGYAMLVALLLVIVLIVFGVANLANDNVGRAADRLGDLSGRSCFC